MPKFKIAYALITPTKGGTHRDTETVEESDRHQAALVLVDALAGEMRAGTVYNFWVVDADGTKIWGRELDPDDDF